MQHNVLRWKTPRSRELVTHYHNLRADIILMNAHGLKADEPLRIHGYKVYQRNQRGQKDDGVAIAVRIGIDHQIIDDFFDEVMAVRVDTALGPIVLATAYLPPRRAYVPFPDILRLAHMQQPVYLLGDLNARHRIFNYRSNFNTVGNALAGLINRGLWQRLGPDFDTFYARNGRSRPDSILANRRAHFNWLAVQGPLTSSDHCPIVMTLSSAPIEVPAPQKHRYSQADWPAYTYCVERSTAPLVLDGRPTGDIETALDMWYANIDEAKRRHIPMTNVRNLPHPRQSHRQRVLQVAYRALHDEARRGAWTPQLYHRQKVLQRQLLEESLRLSSELWGCQLVKLMGKIRHPGDWFREIRRLRGSKRMTPYILDERNNQKHYSDQERGLLLEDHWEDVWEDPPERDPMFDRRFEAALRRDSGAAIRNLGSLQRIDMNNLGQGDDQLMQELSAPVTVVEVLEAIKSVPDKCPGFRQVCKKDLLHLPRMAVENLTEIFNACLASGSWPKAWKHASVCFIPKAQSPHLVSGHRPISLLELPGKILERLVCRRLTDLLEERNILHPDQYGFRRRRGTGRALALIWERCASVVAQRGRCNVVLRDVKSAFDRVWHFGLKYKLLGLGLPHCVTRMLYSFLDDRTASVRVGNYQGRRIGLRCGVPQGSVLSPVLYILYTADTPVPRLPSKISSYADDNIQLSIEQGRSRRMLARRTERDVALVNRYESRWKTKSNLPKTQLLSVASSNPADVVTEDGPLPFDREVKALGLRLNRCGFRPQVDYNRAKAKRALATLYRFADLPWKAKRRLYITIVRPLLEYPVVPLHLGSRASMKKLQGVQNRAIMWITGHRFREDGRPSIRRLHRLLRLEPVNIRLHRLAGRTWDSLEADGDPNYEEVRDLAALPPRRRVRVAAGQAPSTRWWPSSLNAVRLPMPRAIYSSTDY